MKVTIELIERFHEKWELNGASGCWEWIGSALPSGYGTIKRPGQRSQIYAHRLSYLIHFGDLPDKSMVCHACDNPRCVKPSHLFLGDAKGNALDMKAKDRHLHGDRNGNSRLTNAQVKHIHLLVSQGKSQGDIGRIFGVAQSTIWKIVHGHRYTNVFNEIAAAGQVAKPGEHK